MSKPLLNPNAYRPQESRSKASRVSEDLGLFPSPKVAWLFRDYCVAVFWIFCWAFGAFFLWCNYGSRSLLV